MSTTTKELLKYSKKNSANPVTPALNLSQSHHNTPIPASQVSNLSTVVTTIINQTGGGGDNIPLPEDPAEGNILRYNGTEWTASEVTNVGGGEPLLTNDTNGLSFKSIIATDAKIEVTSSPDEVSVGLGAVSLNDLSDVVVSGPSTGQLLQYDGTSWINTIVPDIGEANTASNVGTGEGVFAQKTNVDLEFKSISGQSPQMSVTSDASTITVALGTVTLDDLDDVAIDGPVAGQYIEYTGSVWENVTPPPVGETNTASNVGSAGEGLFARKTGVNFEFKNLDAGSNKVSIGTGATDRVTVDVEPSNITLAELGDVAVTNATDGQVLQYDSGTSSWVNATSSGGATTLDGLTDVAVSAPSAGNILIYNPSTTVFENRNIAMGHIYFNHHDANNSYEINMGVGVSYRIFDLSTFNSAESVNFDNGGTNDTRLRYTGTRPARCVLLLSCAARRMNSAGSILMHYWLSTNISTGAEIPGSLIEDFTPSGTGLSSVTSISVLTLQPNDTVYVWVKNTQDGGDIRMDNLSLIAYSLAIL